MTDASITLDAAALKARIATLEAELAAERDETRRAVMIDQQRHDARTEAINNHAQAVAWQARANALRDALEKQPCMCNRLELLAGYADAACLRCTTLAAHPAASLAAHDAEVLDNVLGLMDSVSIDYTEAEWHELGRKLREQRDALAAQAQEVKP